MREDPGSTRHHWAGRWWSSWRLARSDCCLTGCSRALYTHQTRGHDDRSKESRIRTIDRVPRKDAARLETTPDLVHPVVVKLHPLGLLAEHLGGLGFLPEIIRGELVDASDRVPAPTTPKGVSPHTERSAQHGATGRGNTVPSVTPPEEEGRDQEDDRRECECEPVTHILRGPCSAQERRSRVKKAFTFSA